MNGDVYSDGTNYMNQFDPDSYEKTPKVIPVASDSKALQPKPHCMTMWEAVELLPSQATEPVESLLVYAKDFLEMARASGAGGHGEEQVLHYSRLADAALTLAGR